jgi:regulator of protease activity HflC (stomatin/prohibitin superfamily)
MGPIIAAIIIVFVIAILSISIKVINEYERGVIFRLGRLMGAKGPGFFMLSPEITSLFVLMLSSISGW